MCFFDNSKDLVKDIKSKSLSVIKCINIFFISTLDTTILHSKLKLSFIALLAIPLCLRKANYLIHILLLMDGYVLLR